MNHSHNHDPEALIVARYHKTNPNLYATPIWTGIFDPSFRVLILPRYLGVQTAIIPIPSSRRITSSEYEQEQEQQQEQQQEEQQEEQQSKESESKDTLSSSSPTPSTHSSYSCSCSSDSSHSVPRTSSSSSNSSYASISTAVENTHPHTTHPSMNISEEQSLYIPQFSPKRLASLDHFSEIQETPIRTSTPKPSLDMLSDSDSDCDDDDDDYDSVVDDDDDFQPVIKNNEEEDSAICDLIEGFRKMSI